MKISTNQKLIDRNVKISKYTLYGSLALLAFGFYWSIKNTGPENSLIGWVILIPSYFLVQVSIFMSNKWGKNPRPDEIVLQSLKGLNDKYSLYNYNTAVPHLLVGPQGVWVINPYHQRGDISFDSQKSTYQQSGGPRFIGKSFGQEGLPNIEKEVKNLQKDIHKHFEENSITMESKIEIVNMFYSEEVKLIGNNFPDKCIKADKLKDLVRKEAKKHGLAEEDLSQIRGKLPQFD